MNLTPDQLTAYALGEGTSAERTRIATLIAADPEAASEVAAMRDTAALLTAGLASEAAPAGLDPTRRAALAALRQTKTVQVEKIPAPSALPASPKIFRFPHRVVWPSLLAAGLAVVVMRPTESISPASSSTELIAPVTQVPGGPSTVNAPVVVVPDSRRPSKVSQDQAAFARGKEKAETLVPAEANSLQVPEASFMTAEQVIALDAPATTSDLDKDVVAMDAESDSETESGGTLFRGREESLSIYRSSDLTLRQPASSPAANAGGVSRIQSEAKRASPAGLVAETPPTDKTANGDSYPTFSADGWHQVGTAADDVNRLSTLGADVDTASYANVRRILAYGQLPPAEAVRTEELLNSFHYAYAPPTDRRVPFAVHPEVGAAPWAPEHHLVRIALKAYELGRATRPPANLVFLVDVSGSMNEPTKLPLVQRALTLLTTSLRADDRVAIVTYAGAAGVRLEPTSVENITQIQAAIDGLSAGGSTNGAGGIRIAYEVAKRSFIRNGVNRVVLCTDGDFNVGVSSRDDLERLITDEARSNVFLTALGFGMGNYHDTTLQVLADKGNGQYAYIDSEAEARKQIVDGGTGMLVTIAKDVKLQIEFNPAQVGAWRLLGYEKRHLEHQDFADDRKDGGEIGAGHTMTALYEIIPTHRPAALPALRYAPAAGAAAEADAAPTSGELLTISLRWKLPEGATSTAIAVPVHEKGGEPSNDFRFASAVAEFAESLRGTPGSWSLDRALSTAQATATTDPQRQEFIDLIRKAQQLRR